jgi:natural product precursor
MKKVKLTGKLNLNKETVAYLNTQQMNQVAGGKTATCIGSCTCSGTNLTNSPTRIDCCL